MTLDSPSKQPVLGELMGLFFENPEALGQATEKSAEELPEPYRQLLAHHAHMTVTVEEFHGCSVSVEVLDRRFDEPFYSREIVLRRTTDQKIVQYGIVRLDVTFLDDEVCEAILAETIPLGRVLIEHNVMREVQLSSLWEFAMGERLAKLFSSEIGTRAYGRTALIFFDEDPVIELLEIVAP